MRLTSQEAVKLDQELQVDIVALGGLAVSALDVVAVEIDTWNFEKPPSARWFMLKYGRASCRQDGVQIAEMIRKVSSPLAYAGDVSSFTYPWRRLVLKSLMMGLIVKVEEGREYRGELFPEVSGLGSSIRALIGPP